MADTGWLPDEGRKTKRFAGFCVRCRKPIRFGETYGHIITPEGYKKCCQACKNLPDLFPETD